MSSESPSESRASAYSPFQRLDNQECFYLQPFARALWLGGGVGGETVMLTKLYCRFKESDGFSLNVGLSTCKHNEMLLRCPTVQTSMCCKCTSKRSQRDLKQLMFPTNHLCTFYR